MSETSAWLTQQRLLEGLRPEPADGAAPSTLKLILFIVRGLTAGGEAATVPKIVDGACTHERTVRRCLAVLVDRGWLSVDRSAGHASRYVIDYERLGGTAEEQAASAVPTEDGVGHGAYGKVSRVGIMPEQGGHGVQVGMTPCQSAKGSTAETAGTTCAGAAEAAPLLLGVAVEADPTPPPRRRVHAPDPKPRKPNPWWDAVLEVFPEQGPVATKADKKRVGQLARDFRAKAKADGWRPEGGPSPRDVLRRKRRRYGEQHPDWTLTANAVLKHWGGLRPPQQAAVVAVGGLH